MEKRSNSKPKTSSKLVDKQKKKFKKIQQKYYDQVVDYFPRDADTEGMGFNKAPVVKSYTPGKKDASGKAKRTRSTGLSGSLSARNLYQDYVSDEDDDDLEMSKKIKPDVDLEDYEDGLLSTSKGMTEYFADNKNAFKTLNKIGNFNYDEGSIVLAAVCDKGPNDKYLVVSLPRNKKGYVYCTEAGRDGVNSVKSFQIGEYVLGMTLNSDPRKVQFSIKPETINRELRIAQVNTNQVLCGYLRDKEDYGYTVDFCTEDGATGFLYFPEMAGLELVLGKPYLFSINGKNETTNVFDCQIIHSALQFSTQAINYNELADQDEEGVADLQRLADPGNLVQAYVKKKLENGLLVNFLNLFYGFIFQDHLEKPLSAYKLNQKIIARIIATNTEVKQIHLSDLAFHVGLNVYNTEVAPGTKFQKAFVKEELYGGSYILEVGDKPAKKGKKAEVPQEGSQVHKAFLHSTHIVQEEGEEEDALKVGASLKKDVFVKTFNYFEHYLIVSMRDDILSKIQNSFTALKAGDIATGVVTKIIEGGAQGARVIVSVNNSVTGVVTSYHLSDLGSKKGLKNIKEGKKVKVRVLSVDIAGKKMTLTMKPSLLDSNIEVLSDYQDAQTGVAYYGMIIGSSEKGYVFKFFNDIQGFLPFQDIEHNGSKKEDFALGQVVKVYVKFVDITTKKMGLTLSGEATKNLKSKEGKWNNIKDQNETIKNVAESNISEGDVYEYKILKKKSAVNENYLYAKSTKGVILEKGVYVAHTAILPKSHCSDFEVHNERIFEFYKLSDSVLQAKVIGFLPNNNILITQKPSLIRQSLPRAMEDLTEKHSYFGYVDTCIQSGARIKLSEHVKGILSTTKLPESIQEDFSSHFGADKTLQVLVTKIKGDQNKLYFELSAPQKENMNVEDEKSFFVDYLNEEFMLASQEVSSNLTLWNTYKIGNYIKGTIQMVKDYGIIINLNGKLAGLILKSNLSKSIEEYKVGQQVYCRVLDVDYEKSIVDLSEETLDAKKFESKLSKKLNYNREKIVKYKLHKAKGEVLSATVLLVKELYLVAKLVKHPKVLVLIQCKRFNDFYLSHEVFQKDSVVKFKSLNGEVFNATTKDSEALRKSNNTLIGEVFMTGKKDESKLNDNANKSDLKKKMKVGLKVSGAVTKITGNNVFVALAKSMFGRIHKTQFDYDEETKQSAFDNCKVGDEIECRVISIRKGDHIYIDLTARKSLVEQGDAGVKIDASEFIVDTVEESHKGKKFVAIVKSVSAKSSNPLYFELSNTIFAHVGLFEGLLDPHNTQVTDQFDKITHIEDYYKPGDLVEVWIKGVHKKTANRNEKGPQYSIEVALYDPTANKSQDKSEVALGTKAKTEYKIGDLVICRIVKVLPRGVKVRFARNEYGFVDLTEIYDEFHAYPLKKIEEKANTVMLGRILAMSVNDGSKSKGSEIYISLRESVLNPDNWKVISQEGTTIQFKKKLGYQEERGDLRSRIYKIGASAVKENMIFVGYVNETNDKGCFVKIGFNLNGRATHKELADSELQNPSAVFFKNRLVIGRVLSVREDGKFDVTLREQGVKYGYKLDESKLKVGLLIKGIVSSHFKNSAVIALPGCRYSGILRAEEVNTEGRSMEKAFPVGTSILTKIKNIEKSAHSMQLKLTCRIDESEINDKSNIFNALEEEKSKESEKVIALYDTIQEVSKEYETLGDVSNINTGLVENLEAQHMQEEVEEGEEEENEVEQGEGEEEEENEAQESDDEEGDNVPNQRMMIEFGEDDMEEEKEDVNDDEINEEQSVISEEEEIGENMEFILSNKSASKKKKEIQKMKFEAEVREREKKLLDEQEKELKTSDDYEKILLKNPNSSYIWIQYVAFKFQKDGIEKARQLIERAIRTITFRNENEKLNLWTAYINLEYNFGTEESLLKTFERAKGANNPKQVFMKLIDLYRANQKWDHVEELSKAMIKKHKNSSKAWISHLGDMLDVMKSKGVQNLDLSGIISRALQSLPKRKHLKLLPQHGILLFKNGAQEKGRTVFEAIVANYPKRTDIWSIYADMETKYGDKERFRNLMERCLALDLNTKKMKFFFKRYLQYESKFGTQERVEYVKNKAREYIESQMGNNNNQDDDNGDEEEAHDE